MNWRFKYSTNNLWPKAVFFFIVFVVTFPSFDPSFGVGLDNSYLWLFNFLFENDYEKLLDLKYPFGPLGFLKMPAIIGYNFELALTFYTVLKFTFIYKTYKFCRKHVGYTLSIVVVLYASAFINIDYLFTFSVLFFCLDFLKNKTGNSLLFASMIACIGLYIKSSIGITANSIIIFSLIIYSWETRKLRECITPLSIYLISFILIGLIVFQGIGFIQYLINLKSLSTGYSSVMPIHFENNWYLLSILFITLIWGVIKHQNIRIPLLLIFALFAAWKHGITREDGGHVNHLFIFLIIYWFFISISSNQKLKYTVVAIISIYCFHQNIITLPGYNTKEANFGGYSNIKKIVLNLSVFKEKMKTESQKNIATNRLPEEILSLIGNNTIDFYPWEHTYAAANNFNWHGRKTIEIGASTSIESEQLSAYHYQNSNSPKFVLFHLNKDPNKLKWGSIDKRLLLNNEPSVIVGLLNNYHKVSSTKKFILLEKNNNVTIPTFNTIQKINSKWSEWIEIPKSIHPIRAKINFKYLLWGKAKNILYKDNLYSIEYKLSNGKILNYRVSPVSLKSGIWLTPLSSNNNLNPISFRLLTTSLKTVSPEISINMEEIILKNSNWLIK